MLRSVALARRPFTRSMLVSPSSRRLMADESATKISLNFSTPEGSVAEGEYDWISIPASTGFMTIYPQHVANISELKAGLVQVQAGDQLKRYFASGGFATTYDDSRVHVTALEAVPLEDLDAANAQAGLDEANRELSSAKNEEEKTAAEIKVETFNNILMTLQHFK